MGVDSVTGATGNVAPVVEAANLAKVYPGVTALRGVNFRIDEGEVHGLVGENGSGKSTLVGILAGLTRPDPPSEVRVGGQPLAAGRPWIMRARGVALLHQELMIVPAMSVLDNVFLGAVSTRIGFVDSARMRAEFEELTAELGIALRPEANAGRLSVSDQTLVEVLRAMRSRARVVIMDEPTSSLGSEEREKVYRAIAALQERGTAVVFISHDLDEVLEVCERVTVLRDGSLVLTEETARLSKEKLVSAMLGRDASSILVRTPRDRRRREPRRTAALSVSNVVLASGREPSSFSVDAGEIVGLAGLVGAGRTELLKAIAGAAPIVAGEMILGGHRVRWPKNPSAALQHGIALLPEDRKREGLILGRSAVDNVTLTDLGLVSKLGMIHAARASERALKSLQRLAFRGNAAAPVRTLSGGNQQKVVFGKWLHRRPEILLIDEPTRGVDVGAKREMLDVVRKLADSGAAVLLVTSEFEELAYVCDRVLVVDGQRIVSELHDVTVKAILQTIFGTRAQSERPAHTDG